MNGQKEGRERRREGGNKEEKHREIGQGRRVRNRKIGK